MDRRRIKRIDLDDGAMARINRIKGTILVTFRDGTQALFTANDINVIVEALGE